MFGESEKIKRLQREIDELRDYCIKFTSDVNKWAQSQGELIRMMDAKMNDLEEKQK